MEIKLNSWDMNEAIQDYLKKKFSLNVDMNDLSDYPCIEYTEYQFAYKKHKNGKLKKCKDGYSIIDHENSKHETKYAELGDGCSISFYLN